MTSSRELTYGLYGGAHDALLRQCDNLMPSWLDDSYPTGVIARLIWLDRQKGVDAPDNVIYMAAGYAMWLPMCVEIVDEELRRFMAAGDESEAAQARMMKIQARGFQVKFIFPEGGGRYPDWIHDKVRTIRVLSDEQSLKFPPVFTAKSDGSAL